MGNPAIGKSRINERQSPGSIPYMLSVDNTDFSAGKEDEAGKNVLSGRVGSASGRPKISSKFSGV